MNAKTKAIKHCQKNHLIVPFFHKKVNRIFDEALNIAIKERTKKMLKSFRSRQIVVFGNVEARYKALERFEKEWLGGKE